MSTMGFHSEWMTIKNHRILLECRSGFPDIKLRFDTRLSVEIVQNNSRDAKVVRVYYDDKIDSTNIQIASCNKDDKLLERVVEGVFHTIFPGRILYCDVMIVAANPDQSDPRTHTEYLSLEAGVAAPASRERHKDAKVSADLSGLREKN